MRVLQEATMTNAASLNRTLFISDNLPILRGIDSESVDLIATDPPFNKGVKAFEGIVTAGQDKAGKKVSYKDTWTWGDVQEDWAEAIREDHPKLHSVIQAANASAGEGMGGVPLLVRCACFSDAPRPQTNWQLVYARGRYGQRICQDRA